MVPHHPAPSLLPPHLSSLLPPPSPTLPLPAPTWLPVHLHQLGDELLVVCPDVPQSSSGRHRQVIQPAVLWTHSGMKRDETRRNQHLWYIWRNQSVESQLQWVIIIGVCNQNKCLSKYVGILSILPNIYNSVLCVRSRSTSNTMMCTCRTGITS